MGDGERLNALLWGTYDYADKRLRSASETVYRRGFQQGAVQALKLLREGATVDHLAKWCQRELGSWRYTMPLDVLVVPPDPDGVESVHARAYAQAGHPQVFYSPPAAPLCRGTLTPSREAILLEIECWYCGRKHTHGWGPDDSYEPSHRVAHCGSDQRTERTRAGYYIAPKPGEVERILPLITIAKTDDGVNVRPGMGVYSFNPDCRVIDMDTVRSVYLTGGVRLRGRCVLMNGVNPSGFFADEEACKAHHVSEL